MTQGLGGWRHLRPPAPALFQALCGISSLHAHGETQEAGTDSIPALLVRTRQAQGSSGASHLPVTQSIPGQKARCCPWGHLSRCCFTAEVGACFSAGSDPPSPGDLVIQGGIFPSKSVTCAPSAKCGLAAPASTFEHLRFLGWPLRRSHYPIWWHLPCSVPYVVSLRPAHS